MRPSAAILDGEMEHQNGEIEHHMKHQNGEIGHQNKEMEHQNGEMDWFEYTPACTRGIQPPDCNSIIIRIMSVVLISYTAPIFFGQFRIQPRFFSRPSAHR